MASNYSSDTSVGSQTDEDADFVPNEIEEMSEEETDEPPKKKQKKTRKTKTNNKVAKKRPRKRENSKRYDKRVLSIDHNDFFVNLDAESADLEQIPIEENQLSTEKSSHCIAIQTEPISQYEDIFQIIRESTSNFQIQFSALQKQLARIEVKLNYRRVQTPSESTESECDVDDLKTMGLPVTNMNQLKELEEKLSGENYRKELVRSNISKIYLTLKLISIFFHQV